MSQDDHDKKDVTITVNGKEKHVEKRDISYEQVVSLAFDNPPTGDNILITVTYRRGEGNKEGSLKLGGTVKAKDGMIFDVTATDRS